MSQSSGPDPLAQQKQAVLRTAQDIPALDNAFFLIEESLYLVSLGRSLARSWA